MRHPDRDQAIAQTYLSGAYTVAEIGCHFGIHYMTVSRAARKFEEDRKKCCNVVMLELTPRFPLAPLTLLFNFAGPFNSLEMQDDKIYCNSNYGVRGYDQEHYGGPLRQDNNALSLRG